MALFGGNLTFQFQSKFLLRLRLIRCCSGPIRYIPQNSTAATKQSEIFSTKNNQLKFQKSQSTPLPKNCLFFGDGKELEEEEEEEEIEQITGKIVEDAEKVAITAIAARALPAVELQNKLAAKGFAPKVIDKVLTEFQSKGYINDYLYAETFSQSRWSSSTWGPKRIKQALQRKGISRADADKATKHVFESGGDGDDNEPASVVLGMSKLSMDHLLLQASNSWMRSQNVPLDKRKSRLISWLQYRGFNWGVVSFILKKLESQYPP